MDFQTKTLMSDYNTYLTEQGLTEEALPFNQYVRKVECRNLIVTKSNDGTESFRLSEVLGFNIEHGDGFIQIDKALENEYNDYKFKLECKFYTNGETFIDHLTGTCCLVIGTLDNLNPNVSTIIIDSENGFDFYYVVDPEGNVYEYIDDLEIETDVEEIEEIFNRYKEHLNDNFLTTEHLIFEDYLSVEFDKEFVVEVESGIEHYYLAENGSKLFEAGDEHSFDYSDDLAEYIDGYEEFLTGNGLSCSIPRFEEYLDGLIENQELLLDGVEASYEYDGNQFILVEDESED